MSARPSLVAIVGRPNVGKSTLANRLAGRRSSIVDALAGVTRDRVSLPARLGDDAGGRAIEIIDTGGVGVVDRGDLGPKVEQQIARAVEQADLVLFVVDAREGLTPLDQEVARRLRGLAKPVLLVANKVEGKLPRWELDDFRRLGVREGPIAISAQNGEGIHELEDRIAALLPPLSEPESAAPGPFAKGAEGAPDSPETAAADAEGGSGDAAVATGAGPRPLLRLAVVGRRNAGKSTLVNTWAQEERVIVSEVPGTTRDAIDVRIDRGTETWMVIDTAGLRRVRSFEHGVDFYSDVRSHEAVRRADVVLLLFDATEELSQIEKKLARYCRDHYKPVILGANKWDKVQGAEPEDFRKYLDAELPGLAGAPVTFLSAKSGWHAWETLDLARELYQQAARRVGTGELNRVVERALESRAPGKDGARVRVYYCTQTGEHPPTFTLFVNDKDLIGKDWLRYLEGQLREAFDLHEVPLRLALRERERSERGKPG